MFAYILRCTNQLNIWSYIDKIPKVTVLKSANFTERRVNFTEKSVEFTKNAWTKGSEPLKLNYV